MTKYTAVLSILSQNQMYYSHHGLVKTDSEIKLSDSHKTKNYQTTEFNSEQELNEAIFQIVQNRNEILKEIKAAQSAYSIVLEARIESKHSAKTIYEIKF